MAATSIASTKINALSTSFKVGASMNGLKASLVSFAPSARKLVITCAADAETIVAVQKIIAKQLAVDEEKVVPAAKFVDLGADSLDTVEIIMALEEEFDITLAEDEGAEKIATVQDAADLIFDLVKAK